MRLLTKISLNSVPAIRDLELTVGEYETDCFKNYQSLAVGRCS
jgi:hypothetical protein